MEDLLQFLYLMPVGVVKFRADGGVEMMNPVASALLLSIGSAETLDDIYTALAPLAPELRNWVGRFTGRNGTIVEQLWLPARAGSEEKMLSLTVNLIKADVYMAVLVDVTKLAQQERKLYADRQKFFAIFNHVRDYAIYTITLDGAIEEWNESVQRYGGWVSAEVQGKSLNMFFPPDDPDRPRVESLLAEALRVGSIETEGWRLKRDGTRLWANSVITALPDEEGTVRGFVVVSRDMTERKRSEDDMKLLASLDPLTGAHNRRQGDVLLAAEFNRRARNARPFAVFMLDIDHFKTINDTFGHAVGDAVLIALARTCHDTLRAIDVVARWGGEEFLMVLPETGTAEAMIAAERVRAALEATDVAAPGGTTIRFTVSIGVAVSAGESPSELLRRSDAALYVAKTGGRNRVELAP
jgi:diguanylate cyclase (GGDEF)-like protein/PAS domain S-box-containing protein